MKTTILSLGCKIVLCCIFITIAINGVAQYHKVCGTILNNETNKPITKVSVCLKNVDDCAITDESGNFCLFVHDSLKRIDFDDFENLKTVKVEKQGNGSYNVYLRKLQYSDLTTMSIDELLNVEVTTAAKHTQLVSDVPASVVVVTRQEIAQYGYCSLEEILENVPGLYNINDRAWYASSFGIRGFWSNGNRNLIFMINGISQRMDQDGVYIVSMFNLPVEAIDRIEVIRGPMSVIYGSGAFFGAINIITNEKQNAQNMVSLTSGSMKTRKASVRLTKQLDDFSINLNAGYMQTYGPDFPLDKMINLHADTLKKMYGNSSTGGTLEDDIRYINLSSKIKNFYADLSYSYSRPEYYAFLPPQNEGAKYDKILVTARLGYRKKLSKKLTLDANMRYRKGNIWLDWNYHTIRTGNAHARSEVFENELRWEYKNHKQLNITGSLFYNLTTENQHSYNGSAFPLLLTFKLPENFALWGGFAQTQIGIGEKINITAGFRLERQEKYNMLWIHHPGWEEAITHPNGAIVGPEKRSYMENKHDDFEFIPRLAVLYSLNESNIVKFFYGKAINRSPLYKNYNQFRAGREPLELEKIQTYELNYISNFKANTINFSLFYNKLDNLIIRTAVSRPDGTWIAYNDNIGELETKGAELTLKSKITNKLISEFSITYQNTVDQKEGYKDIDVSYSPEIVANGKLAYKLSENISLALTGNFVDHMKPYWDPQRAAESGNGRIGDNIDSYFLLGVNLRANKLFKTGLYSSLKVTNLLNTEYRYPVYQESTFFEKGTLGNKRYFQVSVGYVF